MKFLFISSPFLILILCQSVLGRNSRKQIDAEWLRILEQSKGKSQSNDNPLSSLTNLGSCVIWCIAENLESSCMNIVHCAWYCCTNDPYPAGIIDYKTNVTNASTHQPTYDDLLEAAKCFGQCLGATIGDRETFLYEFLKCSTYFCVCKEKPIGEAYYLNMASIRFYGLYGQSMDMF